ncbi:MAG: hypothetical protein ACYTDY_16860 [Planctomycetota bacterium]|jgi:hypothetical protein
MKKAVLVLLVPVLLVAFADAQEESKYKRWKLDFERGKLDFVAQKDALGKVTLHWYLTYKIANKTKKEVPLQIAIHAKTDTNKTYRDSIDPLAQRALEKQMKKKFKNALAMGRGKIKAGETLEAVAFFGDLDPNYDRLDVHVAGLVDPIDQVKGKLFYEKKVLILTYLRPGDEFGAAADPITFKGEKWITEGERKEIPQKP